MHYRLNGHEFEQILGDSEEQGSLAWLQSMGLQRIGHDLVTEQQQKMPSSKTVVSKYHFHERETAL